MKIYKEQIIKLIELFLTASQKGYKEVQEEISLSDQLFLNTEFVIHADEDTKKLLVNKLSVYPSYFRKNELIQGSISLKSIRENIIFLDVASKWETTTCEFNTHDALEQFCSEVAFEHQAVYGLLGPHCSTFIEPFAEVLLNALEKGAYPNHCRVFLKNLWVEKTYNIVEPFQPLKEDIPNLKVRRPTEEDYARCQDWKNVIFFGGIDNLQIRIGMQTAVLEFSWYDKKPIKLATQPSSLHSSIKFQNFRDSLGTIILLLGNTSIRMTGFHYNFRCSGGPISIFDKAPERCLNINNLEKKLRWVGQLMLPLLMNEAPMNDTIKRTLNFYQDSLFRNLGPESRVSLSISGLEALYLSNEGAKTEIILRLSLRMTKLLSYLDFDPIQVKKIISKAYDIRSSHVHGSNTKKENNQIANDLSEIIDNYLRLSILAIQHCLKSGHPLEGILNELHNASFSLRVSESLSQCLLEVKEILSEDKE